MSAPPAVGMSGVARHAASPWRRRLSAARLRRNPIGLAGFVIVLATVLVALLGPLVWRINYADQAWHRLLAPTLAHPMGTDNLGRDELSRVIHGAWVSLQVGIIAVLIAFALGSTVGVIAGFYRGCDRMLS